MYRFPGLGTATKSRTPDGDSTGCDNVGCAPAGRERRRRAAQGATVAVVIAAGVAVATAHVSPGEPPALARAVASTASLQSEHDGDPNAPDCAAVIVDPRWAITAAHCVNRLRGEPADAQRYAPSRFHLRIGTDNHTSGGVVRQVVAIVTHPEWSETNSTADHDLALLELDSPVDVAAVARIAPVDTHAPALAITWTAHTTPAGIPQVAPVAWRGAVPIVEDTHCPAHAEGEVCLQTGPGATGPGTSGAGLYQSDAAGAPVAIAIMSRGGGTVPAPGSSVTTGLATRLADALPWIRDITAPGGVHRP